MKRTILLSAVAVAFIASSRGDEPAPDDKSRYTLFNPTPAESMRPWRTDNAGVSPYTIDAGHFEVNITAVSWAYDEAHAIVITPFTVLFPRERTEAWRYGSTALKVGLLNRLDAEVIVRPYETITTTVDFTPRLRRTVSGFGDVTSRLKFNVWGNDSGSTALSISGNVKYPTADRELGNGQFEGGGSLEFAAQAPWGFELRIDSLVNFFEDGRNERQASFENLISLSHQIIGNLQAYCMFNTVAYTTDIDWLGEVKAGLNYRVATNVELFVGSYFGVTDRASDYQAFGGIAARF